MTIRKAHSTLVVAPSSEHHLKTNLSREECLETVVRELNAIGNATQEMSSSRSDLEKTILKKKILKKNDLEIKRS